MKARQASPLSIVGTVAVYILLFWVMLPAFLLTLGMRIDELAPVPISAPSYRLVGWVWLFLGPVLVLGGMTQLWVRGRGLPISHLPPIRFVSKGLYRHIRHPIYVGYTAIFAGLGFLWGSFWTLAFSTPLLVLGWVSYALFYEEPVLSARFGQEYRDYKKRTALLFPRKLAAPLRKALHPIIVAIVRRCNKIADRTILFRRGNIILASYGVFVTIGAVIFMLYSGSLFFLQGLERRFVAMFLLGAALLTAFFSHLFWWFGQWREARKRPWKNIRKVGFSSYGAFFGLVFSSLVFGTGAHTSPLMVLDVVVRGMFIAYAIGRIGCLTYGCCWGRDSATHGIIYHNPEAKVVRMTGPGQTVRHPTPLYSAIEGLVLFILLNGLSYFRLPAGFLTALVFLVYPIGRSLIEFYRERKHTIFHYLNEGHLCCAGMFLAGVFLLFLLPVEVNEFSPLVWHISGLVQSLSILPVVIGTGALIFVITSFHWRRVGTW